MNLVRYLFALIVLASPASAAGYVRAAGLFNQPGHVRFDGLGPFTTSLRKNDGIAVAIGYAFPFVRLEAELQHLRAVPDAHHTSGTLFGGIQDNTGTIKETDGFANIYFDLPPIFRLRPYLGAGLGFARVTVDRFGRMRNGVLNVYYSGSDSVFGYQGMAGLRFALLGRIALNAGYRVVSRGETTVRQVPVDARHTLVMSNNRMCEVGLGVTF